MKLTKCQLVRFKLIHFCEFGHSVLELLRRVAAKLPIYLRGQFFDGVIHFKLLSAGFGC